MLKSVLCALIISMSMLISAKTIASDLGHNSHAGNTLIGKANKAGEVEIYEN